MKSAWRRFGSFSRWMSTYRVYSCGNNAYGQLGAGCEVGDFVLRPVQTLLSDDVVDSSSKLAGGHQTMFMFSDRQVFGWGKNGEYQLLDLSIEDQFEPKDLASEIHGLCEGTDDRLRHLAASHGSVYAVLGSKVLCWGTSNRGQLLLNSSSHELGHSVSKTPIRVSALDNKQINALALGLGHGALSDSEGNAWLWGAQSMYGSEHASRVDNRLHKLVVSDTEGDHFIANVACGMHHTMLASHDGMLFGMGQNELNSLGLGDSKENLVFEPRRTTLDLCAGGRCSVLSMAAGLGHTLVSVKHQGVYACGFNHDGQLGIGRNHPEASDKTSNRFALIPGTRDQSFPQVACGRLHSVLLRDDGRVFSCGSASFGSLMNEEVQGNEWELFEVDLESLIEEPNAKVIGVACTLESTSLVVEIP